MCGAYSHPMMTDSPGRRRPIGYWVKLVDRLLEEQLDGTLQNDGLTRREWQLLNTLSDSPRSQEELEDAVSPFLANGATLDQQLAGLTRRALITSVEKYFALTDAGALLLQRALESVSAQRQQLVMGLSDDDYERTVATLEAMARNLGWDEQP